MENVSKNFWSYLQDGMKFTVWNSEGRLMLTDGDKIVGRFDTLEEAVEAAVVSKQNTGISQSKLNDLAELSLWQSGSQVMPGAGVSL